MQVIRRYKYNALDDTIVYDRPYWYLRITQKLMGVQRWQFRADLSELAISLLYLRKSTGSRHYAIRCLWQSDPCQALDRFATWIAFIESFGCL